MSAWKEYYLEKITTWKSGGTPSKQNVKYWSGDIPWISAKTFNSSRIFDSEIKITKDGLVNGSRLAKVNSILLLVRGSGLFNDIPIGIVKKPVAFNQDIKSIEPNEEIILPEFLLYWLIANKPLLQSKIEHTGIGAGKFETDIIKKLVVRVPDLPTQTAIAEILSSLDDKIELNNQINQNLEALAQAIFKRWFVDFEFPDENGQPYKSSGGEMVESELGEIPKSWKVGLIGDVADVKGGKRMPNGSELTTVKNDHPYIRVRDFVNSKVDTSNLMYVPQSVWPKIKNYTIAQEDVYITIVGTIGLVGLIPPDLNGANLTENAAKIISKGAEPSWRYYLSLYLNSKQGQDEINARTVGSTQSKLAIFRIKEIPILIPAQRTISEFTLVVENIFDTLFHNDSENGVISQLRDLILPKLISGEIEIKEAEKILQET